MRLCRIIAFVFLSLMSVVPQVKSQQPASSDRNDADTAELRAGKNFLPTPVYSTEDDARLLALFKGLRVADVSDGMDRVGLANRGLVSSKIRPLWRDTKRFTHHVIGIAVTARYVPTNRPAIRAREAEEFDAQVGRWYGDLSPESFTALFREGSVLVLDDATGADVGSIGSNNIMSWVRGGCVGVVTNATARDLDEIIAQKIPLYFRKPGRGIRPGRNELESVNRPVVVGGVLVVPGDVIVADGDGVIVVPRGVAEQVALYARGVLDQDKAGRRRLYEQLGIPLDDSVK
jgi:regulator of RNase E activity RraA